MQSNSFSNLLYKYLSTYTFYCVYLPLIIYWITLFALTTVPVDVVPQLFNYQDKIEHFVAYGVLAFLLTLALFFQKRSRLISSKAFLFTFIFILAYGAIDEIHQLLVPGRFCDLYDWLADSLGGSIGIGIVYLFLKSHLKTRNKAVSM
ncbi:MAG: VanZ family protein [Melioribacteraceae bacterium]